MNLGKLEIKNTKNLISPSTRLCGLIYAPAKFGKTKLAASLDEITRKYRGKPTLIIACEVAEGGGTMTVTDKEIDYVQPSNWSEMDGLIASLVTNESYGGIVLDNLTDYILRIVKPHALKFPSKEKVEGAREVGVPHRGDYQTMAECARQQLNKLINLTNETTPEKFRKDLICTALEKEKSDESGNLTAIRPDLPGALADVVTGMFQDVASIKIKSKVIPDPAKAGATIRSSGRVLELGTGVKVSGSRSGIFQNDFRLTAEDGSPIGLLPLYEAFLTRLQEKVSI